MKKTIISILTTMVLLFFAISCARKNEIEFINHSDISGALLYHTIDGPDKPVPAGAKVTVNLNDEKAPLTTFVTAADGKYSYIAQRKGKYVLSFSYTDTALQYDATLVQKSDLDSTRANSKAVISFTNTAKPLSVTVDKGDHSVKQDVILNATTTGVKLLVTDDQNNPIVGARVCLYSNKTFADQNAPYCGGCLAYLSTNNQGIIYFTDLTAQAYYINARANIGNISLNNQYSAVMKTVTVAAMGQFTPKTIILK